MYTEWGNLKIVSRRAWVGGPDPAAQRCYRRNGRIGGVHFDVKQ